MLWNTFIYCDCNYYFYLFIFHGALFQNTTFIFFVYYIYKCGKIIFAKFYENFWLNLLHKFDYNYYYKRSRYYLNHLTVLPESHTGSDHAPCDLFRLYFTASKSTTQQPTIYNLFRNVLWINIRTIHILSFTHFLKMKQKKMSRGRVV